MRSSLPASSSVPDIGWGADDWDASPTGDESWGAPGWDVTDGDGSPWGHTTEGSGAVASQARDLPGGQPAARADVTDRPRKSRRRWVLAAVLIGILAVVGVVGVWRLLPERQGSDDSRTVAPSAPPSPVAVSPVGVPSDSIVATVTAILDGDTVDTDLGRIRLYGVDAPEAGTDFADEAGAYLATLAAPGSSVWLWRPPGADDLDGYGRLVRVLYTVESAEVNRDLVAAGLAAAYVDFSDRYLAEEEAARAAGLGRWGDRGTASTFVDPGSRDTSSSSTDDAVSQPWNQPGPDLDCSDISGGPVRVLPPDYHALDRDGDGWGCER